jgi:hypothetical protein
MKKRPTAEEVTSDVIEGWKREFDKVVKFTTEDGKVGFFRNPDLQAVDASASIAATNPVKSNQLLAKACFLGGDEEITTESKYILGLGRHLQSLVVRVEGELSTL